MANRRVPQRPQFETKDFSLNDIDLGIKKLNKRISEVSALNAEQLANDDPSKEKVQRFIRDTVAEIFGENSREALQDFASPKLFQGTIYYTGYGDPEPDYTENYRIGIDKMKVDLQGLIEKLQEKREEIQDQNLMWSNYSGHGTLGRMRV